MRKTMKRDMNKFNCKISISLFIAIFIAVQLANWMHLQTFFLSGFFIFASLILSIVLGFNYRFFNPEKFKRVVIVSLVLLVLFWTQVIHFFSAIN